jgi:diguanylate cyclase (GGDEF)-like protein
MGLIFLGPKMTGSLYTKEERNLAGLVVNLSSEALERVKSYEMAIFDGLTNLYVKRYFNERIREEVNNATYNLQALSLILTDIDHFKKFNDTYGHQQGDVVLREVARIIKESLRSGRDVPARYGGEEMAVILPDSESHRAFEVADRIRRNIEASQFPGLPVGVKVTASFGVASFPLNADNPDDLVKKADMALYAAKRNGRNQVVLFDEATMK